MKPGPVQDTDRTPVEAVPVEAADKPVPLLPAPSDQQPGTRHHA